MIEVANQEILNLLTCSSAGLFTGAHLMRGHNRSKITKTDSGSRMNGFPGVNGGTDRGGGGQGINGGVREEAAVKGRTAGKAGDGEHSLPCTVRCGRPLKSHA